MLHTIAMVKEFYPQYSNAKFAVISPCWAKKREFTETGLGDFNVTFSSIQKHLDTHGINLHGYPEIDYSNVPGCTYSQPQVASIGMTEEKAIAEGIEIKVGKFPLSASGKAAAIGEREGFTKLIFDKKYGELLGAHIIGPEATEMIAELGIAKSLESTNESIGRTIHAHPTLSEIIMEAAEDADGKAIHI